MANRPLERISTTTPPAFEVLEKTFQVTRTDTTAFNAFVLPKYAVLAGVYVLGTASSNAATSASISVGTNPGTTNEILAAYDVKTNGAGYFNAGAAAGSLIGGQAQSDLSINAKYVESGTASSSGGPWLVKVEYYFPQTGQSW